MKPSADVHAALAAREAHKAPQRFYAEPEPCSAFAPLGRAPAPGDVLIDFAHTKLARAYSAAHAACEALENLPGTVAFDAAETLARIATEIEDAQAKLRKWDGCSEDEIAGSAR